MKLDGAAASLSAEWDHRGVSFFQSPSSADGKVWFALLGVDVETPPGSYSLAIEAKIAEGSVLRYTRQVAVEAASYRTTELHVAENFVAPDAATQIEIAADKQVKDRAFAHSAVEPEWSGDFVPPVRSPATDSFGTRRTFNGKLASIHRGMDFRAPAGTPVSAANAGTVVLAQKLFYEGNCVVVDHGLGFMTQYMHFSRIDVRVGDKVRKGQRLGLSGATGRVTGPHLHFAVRWQGAYLDPAKLFRLPLQAKP